MQRLIYKAKSLADGDKLSDYIKDDEQTVHLMKKPPPQPAQAAHQAEPTQQ